MRVHPIFDTNMVLQRGKPVRVWGRGDPGETATASFAGQTKTASAGTDGAWAVDLDLVEMPVAVSYAWARNPLGNLVNGQHHERILPVPSFRMDDWDWPEAPLGPEGRGEIGRRRGEMRRQAEQQNRRRRLREAKLQVERLEAEAAKENSS